MTDLESLDPSRVDWDALDDERARALEAELITDTPKPTAAEEGDQPQE
ncbi:MAG: hypothetical protein M3O70_11560 [Actinomycetota bacterium]|nr:hypothetical protein [Actinomycetota bacterium]